MKSNLVLGLIILLLANPVFSKDRIEKIPQTKSEQKYTEHRSIIRDNKTGVEYLEIVDMVYISGYASGAVISTAIIKLEHKELNRK